MSGHAVPGTRLAERQYQSHPVELICYDDGTEASRVEGFYRQLLDEAKVDLVIGGYGTNTLLPAMPLVIERRRFLSD